LDIDDFFKKRMAEHASVREAYDTARIAFPDCQLYEKEPWTFLKLVVVRYYIDIYSNIAKSNFKRIAYIDFYAGPGVNYIEKLQLYVGGSPYLARIAPRKGKEFDDIILFEIDPIKSKSLKLIIPEAEVCRLDCNCAQARDIVEQVIQRNQHYLAFMDPEGIEEIKWATLKNLLQFKGDLIINYPYSAVAREHGKYYGNHAEIIKEKSGILLTEFFGNQDWKNLRNDEKRGDQLLELYLKQLRAVFPIYEVIQLGQEEGGFKFHLIIATRSTVAPWFAAVRNVKHFVSKVRFKELVRFADIQRGDQYLLTDCF